MIRTVVTEKDIKTLSQLDITSLQKGLLEVDYNTFKKVGLVKASNHDISFEQLEEIEKQMPTQPDNYLSRLLKYIPTEIIALYLTCRPLLSSGNNQYNIIHWLIFAFGVVVTPLYLWKKQKVNKKSQLLISTFAFCVWVFAIGGPFAQLDWYNLNPIYATLIVPIYTFLIPLFEAEN
ncbi:hypothetical protein ACFS7Z_08535 [Pontibacter toksunensis]|uniref:Uncharacterized protein n=1 Tax=Pontibacter toksunensis TaxID=1332631 RepID=A0ABW6BTW0_9BACT